MPRIYEPEDEEDDEELDKETDDEGDDDLDDESGDEDDSDEDDDDEPEDDDDAELEEIAASEPKPNGSARGRRATSKPPEPAEAPKPARSRRERQSTRARGPGGMGRPSTGPRVRGAAAGTVAATVIDDEPESDVMNVPAPETEIAPDISSWPGTSEAAKLVGRHTSTIKLWRQQSRIRALQDASGCWRHHPDDLAEAIEAPEGTDPGQVLASGMTAIVQQGSQANGRLLEMTVIATDGLKGTTAVLSKELERAYKRIAELEEKLAELRDKHAATHADDLKHNRVTLRMEQKHELELAGAKETSQRLNGLLQILGPIAASIGARLLGDITGAEKQERQASGSSPQSSAQSPERQERQERQEPAASEPKPQTSDLVSLTPSESRLVPIETRITDAMARLCDVIRKLDRPAFMGLRSMLPTNVAEALDAIVQAESDGTVGRALAVIVQAAQNLSDLQFMALRPIAPSDVSAILGELRAMLREQA